MDAKLLEKIEELHLLTIQLNEEKNILKSENEQLKHLMEVKELQLQRLYIPLKLKLINFPDSWPIDVSLVIHRRECICRPF